MWKRFFSHPFVQGNLIVSVASFAVSFMNYGFNLVVSRGVTLGNYGVYSSALAYSALLGIPFGTFGTVLIRKIGSINPEKRESYIQAVEHWLFESILKNMGIILLISGALSFLLFEVAKLNILSIIFILVLTFFTFLQTFYLSTLQARKVFFTYAAFLALPALIKVLGGKIGISLFPSVETVFIWLLFMSILQVCIGHFLTKKTKISSAIFSFQKPLSYLYHTSYVIPFMTTLGMIGMAQMDMVMAQRFLPASETGLYAAISLMSKIILYLTIPMTSVGFIFLTGKENRHRTFTFLSLTILFVFGAGAVASLGYWLLPHFILSIFFDQRYLILESHLWLAGIMGTLYSLNMVFTQYFISIHSKLSSFALFALIIQIFGLLLYHGSIAQILLVNIYILSMLLFVYLITFGQKLFIFRRDRHSL